MASLAGSDIRTITGKKLKLLEKLSGLDPWIFGSGRIKQEPVKTETGEVPDQDQWRVEYLDKLLEERHYWGDRIGDEIVSGLIDS